MKPTPTYIRHTGEERYEVKLTYAPEQKAEIAKLTQDGQILVDTVVLVWTRKVGQPWQRYTNGRHGSRAEGTLKIEGLSGAVGPRRSKQVFTSTLGELCTWTTRLPGLRPAVDEVAEGLPK